MVAAFCILVVAKMSVYYASEFQVSRKSRSKIRIHLLP